MLSRREYYALILRMKEQERLQAEAPESFATGGPVQPRKPVPVAASSTATVRPANPFQIQLDRQAAIQAQVAANTPVLKPTGYVPEVVKERFGERKRID